MSIKITFRETTLTNKFANLFVAETNKLKQKILETFTPYKSMKACQGVEQKTKIKLPILRQDKMNVNLINIQIIILKGEILK